MGTIKPSAVAPTCCGYPYYPVNSILHTHKCTYYVFAPIMLQHYVHTDYNAYVCVSMYGQQP